MHSVLFKKKGITMKRKYIIGGIALLCVGIVIGCIIKCGGEKMAVVDVSAVVNKSAQIQALKIDLETKKQLLAQWLQNAQNEVNSEKDKKKQEALLQKYNVEFAQRRDAILNNYNERLQPIDKEINDTIIEIAKKNGCTSVIAKGVVIYGGTDITEDVMNVIK